MGRSMKSRLQQQLRDRPLATKRHRSNDTDHAVDDPSASSPRPKRAQTGTSRSVSSLEESASSQRLQQADLTAQRNAYNQTVSSQPHQRGDDEAKFYAAIDEPLSKVCGACGELTQPNATRAVIYSATDPRFQTLAVQTPRGEERGLVEAGVYKEGDVEKVIVCNRCNASLSRHEPPKFSAASGFRLSPVPRCLAVLNPMEARMVGIGICFTTCFSLGYLGQTASRGNSISFWNSTYDIVAKLPRPASRCGVIHLKRPGATGSSTYYPVRPWLLREALNWLIENNSIYKHVLVDEALLENLPLAADVPSVDVMMDDGDLVHGDDAQEDDVNGAFTESFVLEHRDEAHTEDANIVTMLEGRLEEEAFILPATDRPMNEYSTTLLMQSCFPTLFPTGLGGFHPIDGEEQRDHKYKLADFCDHLMAYHDRRFVMHPTFKFFCLNTIQRRQIDGLLLQVRAVSDRSGGADSDREEETVGGAPTQSPGHNRGRKHDVRQYLRDLKPYFKAVRGTGLYWANVRDNLMTMIGNPALENPWPTFFITLSAADTIWPDFFRVCNPDLTLEQASRLSSAQRLKYLNGNPDLAARHFHRRFQAFFRHILCGESRPLGDISDFFWRIEFQHRGSPHVHALLWIKNGPNILELSRTPQGRTTLQEFADKFVSCLRRYHPSDDSTEEQLDPLCARPPSVTDVEGRERDLGSVVERVQQHTCSLRSSCQRSGSCRFGFPKPLQDTTEVVRDVSNGDIRIRFEHKRDHSATNNYNPVMLSTWRANMDVKIIGNAHGAAEYTAAYVSKAEPDTVRFRHTLEAALANLPNYTSYQRVLKRTATAMLAIREVSSQEATYILSSTLCLVGKSRNVLRVKVARHGKRYYRIQTAVGTESMVPPEPTSEFKIEPMELAYMNRPKSPQFRDMPYREFCESYEISASGPTATQHLKRWKLLNDGGYVKEMTKKQVVRPSPKYRANEADPNYCYAQLFLHMPWRALEDIPTDDDSICEAYQVWKDSDSSPWVAHINDTIERQQILDQRRDTEIQLPPPQWSIRLHSDDNVILQTGPSEATQSAFQSRFDYSDDDIDRARRFLEDVVRPFAKSGRVDRDGTTTHHSPPPHTYPTEAQSPSMTQDQWRPFSVCMHQSRLRKLAEVEGMTCEPMRMVISGEGGTGKSWLIKQIVEDVRVVFGPDAATDRVLLMAHQGSAAFLIGGRTLTSALALPGQGGPGFRREYVPLVSTNGGESTLRKLQNQYANVHLIIVDEYGVISSGMLHWIDQRLREIFPTHRHLPFGGRDIVFTGDPSQLDPVKPSSLSTPLELLSGEAEKAGRRLWEALGLFFVLREQNRGSRDPLWYATLRRIREGRASRSDVDLINTRVQPPPRGNASSIVYLSYRNVDVDDANKLAVRNLDQPVFRLNAHHTVQIRRDNETVIDEETRRLLMAEAESITSPFAKHLPLELDLCIGAPVVLTFNIEQRAGLCNGSRGVVYDIIADRRAADSMPIVLVQMADYKGPSFLPNVHGVVPIVSMMATLNTKRDGIYKLTRTSLPLRLGFSTTIHKIQGQTCEKVVFNPVCLKNSALAYVALSRVRHRTDIFISAPMTLSQLTKSDRTAKIDAAENVRVAKVELKSQRASARLISRMKTVANRHNLQITTPTRVYMN